MAVKKDKDSKPKTAPDQDSVEPGATGGNSPAERSEFVQAQYQRLLELQDHLLDAMAGVAQDNLRSRAEGSEASAFGMHQADAGSDAYDRDFALNLLSQEQDALYEIQEAIKRVEDGTYGICEMSGQPIPPARLEAIPFARLTVECQEKVEQQNGFGGRGYGRPTRSLFGLMDGTEEGEPVDNE
jgi:RNA polymerase-binding transcription factor DksA